MNAKKQQKPPKPTMKQLRERCSELTNELANKSCRLEVETKNNDILERKIDKAVQELEQTRAIADAMRSLLCEQMFRDGRWDNSSAPLNPRPLSESEKLLSIFDERNILTMAALKQQNTLTRW